MLNFNNAWGYLILYAVIFVYVIAIAYYLELKPKKAYRVWVAGILWTAIYTFLTWNELIRVNNVKANGFEIMGWLAVLLLVIYLIINKNREGKL